MSNPQFSIVVPLYKSQVHLSKLVEFISESFEKAIDSVELILVFDGVKENFINEDFYRYLAGYHSYKVITLRRNYGQNIATVCGISRSEGQFIITMDSDMYMITNIFNKTLTFVDEDLDLIYAEIESMERSVSRKIGSYLHGVLVRSFSKKKIAAEHTGSSFRIIKKNLSQQLLANIRFASCLDIYLLDYATEIHYEPIINNNSSKSTYSFLRLISVLFDTLICSIRIHSKHKLFNPDIYIKKEMANNEIPRSFNG